MCSCGQRGKVLVGSKKLSLETPHLAGGSGLLCDSTTANNPAHRRVTSQSVSPLYSALPDVVMADMA